MSTAERNTAAERFTRNFLGRISLQSQDVVALYHPIRAEMDVLPLLNVLRERGHVCALPCVTESGVQNPEFSARSADRASRQPAERRPMAPSGENAGGIQGNLVFRRWEPGEALAQGAFSVLEPLSEAPEVTPTVLVVPLLAFDRTGHRLGYGKGFYDRTIRALRSHHPALLCIGAGYEWQSMEEINHTVHDAALDKVVTD